MYLFIFLAIFLLPSQAFGGERSCGDYREIVVPKGVTTPGEIAEIFGRTFHDLKKINPWLTEGNLKVGEPICVPVPSEKRLGELGQLQMMNSSLIVMIEEQAGQVQFLNGMIDRLNFWLWVAIIGCLPAIFLSVAFLNRYVVPRLWKRLRGRRYYQSNLETPRKLLRW